MCLPLPPLAALSARCAGIAAPALARGAAAPPIRVTEGGMATSSARDVHRERVCLLLVDYKSYLFWEVIGHSVSYVR